MAYAVGDTIAEGAVVLRVHSGKGTLQGVQLMRAIRLEVDRTFEQDPKYPIRLLVDIAIKALSPAINDPTTAVQAIDQIEDLLHRLGRRDLDAGYARDANGVLRLIYPMPTWGRLPGTCLRRNPPIRRQLRSSHCADYGQRLSGS